MRGGGIPVAMMHNVAFFLGVLTVLFSLAAFSGDPYAQQSSLQIINVVRLDRRFDKLVPFNVKIEKIAGGHKWAPDKCPVGWWYH
jgi:hypothetical protein